MSFLKENAFLVSVAAVVIVAGGAMLIWASSEGSEGDQAAAVRTDLSRQLVGLAQRPITEGLVRAVDQRVRIVQEYRDKVISDFVARSSAYPIVEFAAADTSLGRPTPAFPIDPVLYDERGARLQFPRLYRKQVQAMLDSLSPTTAPTQTDIEAERQRRGAAAGVTDTTGMGGALPLPDNRRFDPIRGVPAALGGGAPAADLVRDQLVAARAAAGEVYADQSCMYGAVLGEMNYPDEELYMAQVSLWVQQDIIAAIVKTNQEFRQQVGTGRKQGVPGSAVKRLVGLDIRGYVVTPRAGAAPTQRGGQYGAGGYGGAPYGTGGYGGAPMPSPQPGGAAGKLSYIGFGATQASVPQLTQRTTNKLYDVVHYEFTVVISGRQLLPLYRNLLACNYHTIVDVDIGKVGLQPTGLAGAPQTAATSEEFYDYGTDPIVQARITGELLLLADFTRGRWDAQANEWDKAYPPLMPKEFLARLNDQDSSALRQADTKRLTGAPAGTRKGGM